MLTIEWETKVKTKNPFYLVFLFTVPWKRRKFKARVPKSVIKTAVELGTCSVIRAYLNTKYFEKHGWALGMLFYIPIEVLKEMI